MIADGEDRYVFDATETDDQSPGPVNFLMNPDIPGTALGLYFLGGDPGQVCNAGGPRALDEVRLREGSLLQPRFPAALGMRGLTMMRVLATLNGLINVAGAARPAARAAAGAPAAHSAYVITLMRGTAGGVPFLLTDGLGVGYGARPDADGIDAVYFVAQENYPVEFLEQFYPVRLRRYGIVRDSGGPGKFRGGCGIVREYEIMAEHAVLAVRIDSVRNPPWGVAGGMSGGTGRACVNPGTRRSGFSRRSPTGTCCARATSCASRPAVAAAAGIRSTARRKRALEDVLGGFVSAAAAAQFYGVVIVDARVDATATAARRADRPAVRGFHRHDYVDELA